MMRPVDLPRDVWLAVVGKMDMDARIKCGIVFKLRVPEGVGSRIADAVCGRPDKAKFPDRLSLGPYLVWNSIRMPRYIIQVVKKAFYVINLSSDMRIRTFTLDTKSGGSNIKGSRSRCSSSSVRGWC